jgi:hypothetical protein
MPTYASGNARRRTIAKIHAEHKRSREGEREGTGGGAAEVQGPEREEEQGEESGEEPRQSCDEQAAEGHASADIGPHTSAYVSIAYVSIAHVSIRQHTSAHVSTYSSAAIQHGGIRHTSA